MHVKFQHSHQITPDYVKLHQILVDELQRIDILNLSGYLFARPGDVFRSNPGLEEDDVGRQRSA
jgi:hypothetical protein